MSLVRRISNLLARMHCAMSNTANQNGVFDRALEALRKIPRAILVVLVAFALGLGANTAIFTAGYSQFLGLYPHPDELVVLRSQMQGHDDGVSTGDFIRWREQTTVFQDLHASTEGAFRIATQDGPECVAASLVTAGFYRMMGDRFSLGYDFIPADGIPGGGRVVILAHSMWKRLGADPAIIGSILLMNGEPYTVVGVLAPGLRDRGAPVTVPLVFTSERLNQHDQQMNVIGRLKPGVSIREAQADVNAVVARMTRSAVSSNQGVSVEPIEAASLPNDRKFVLWLMMGVVAFVLLIACVSVSNLLRLRSEAGYRHLLPNPRFPLE
jgi:putative ABC transport system permease protein